MEWLVGIDLNPSSSGALHFARWLHRSAVGDGLRIRGAYVLPPQADAIHTPDDERQAWTRQAQLVLGRVVAEAGAQSAVPRTTVAPGADAAEALAAMAEGADALLIGRQAKREDSRLVRLGSVARRLVRRLPVPVAVVPPDLSADTLGDGPILLATSLRSDADGAAPFARTLARHHGRKVIVAHIVPRPDDANGHFVPVVTRERLFAQLEADGRRGLATWMKDHGMHDEAAVVASGGVVDRIIDVARAERCPVIVTGSRRLGLAARFFVSSVGTDLAAGAPCPVVIVPPLPMAS